MTTIAPLACWRRSGSSGVVSDEPHYKPGWCELGVATLTSSWLSSDLSQLRRGCCPTRYPDIWRANQCTRRGSLIADLVSLVNTSGTSLMAYINDFCFIYGAFVWVYFPQYLLLFVTNWNRVYFKVHLRQNTGCYFQKTNHLDKGKQLVVYLKCCFYNVGLTILSCQIQIHIVMSNDKYHLINANDHLLVISVMFFSFSVSWFSFQFFYYRTLTVYV